MNVKQYLKEHYLYYVADVREALSLCRDLDDVYSVLEEVPQGMGSWDVEEKYDGSGFRVSRYDEDGTDKEDFDYYNDAPESSGLKEKTVIVLDHDVQFTLDGDQNPQDTVGCTFEKGIDEVVDDYLVHVYTFIGSDELQ